MPTPNDPAPIACSLNETELRERRAFVRRSLLPSLEDCSADRLAVALRFARDGATKASLVEFVELERQCCGFLSFEIVETAEHLTLEISGPEGAEPVLRQFVEAARASRADKPA